MNVESGGIEDLKTSDGLIHTSASEPIIDIDEENGLQVHKAKVFRPLVRFQIFGPGNHHVGHGRPE